MSGELKLRWTALTDVGLRRSDNQDSGHAGARLLAIADGMGGAAAGDLASATAMEALRELDRELDPELDGDALEALTDSVARGNVRIGELIRHDPAVEGMGTTIDAMLWDGERFAVGHIGDSRIYRLRAGELTQLSKDHTYVQGLVDEGRLTNTEARTHPQRSLLLRAVLGRDELDPEFWWEDPEPGDRYLLCSDGLSDMVTDKVIAETLAGEHIDVVATELVRKALEAGGHDNVTVVIAEVVAADEETPEGFSCSDGRSQLVGAAAGNPQPRSGMIASTPTGQIEASGPDVPEDPEVLRYAPRPKPKHGWLRVLLGIVVVVGALGVVGAVAWEWSQKQYFVGESDGKVTIFRGVDATLPGIELNQVDEVSDTSVDSLPTYHRQRVEKGITVSDRAEAVQIVENLANLSVPAKPESKPTDKPKAPEKSKSTSKSKTGPTTKPTP